MPNFHPANISTSQNEPQPYFASGGKIKTPPAGGGRGGNCRLTLLGDDFSALQVIFLRCDFIDFVTA